MKMVTRIGAALAGLAVLASCTTAPAPPAPPPPVSAPPPTAPVPAPPPPASWQDSALTPGDWRYDEAPGPRASYGSGSAVFIVECTADRQIRLIRPGAAGESLALRTTSTARTLAASGSPEGVAATLAASDPLLDEIAFSRGRILVQVPGQADLVLPTWPEPARVIEDCRGQ